MIVIGITGGIASGKTTLARMFLRPGIVHFDADKAVHRLLQSDPRTIRAIAEIFPKAHMAGRIDRRILGELVSKNAAALTQLEAVLHPAVRRAEIAAIQTATRQRRKALLLDVPLLFETGADALCDVTIAAAIPEPRRRRRAFLRPQMTAEKYARLLARQYSETERLALADIVIPTGLGKGFTQKRVTLWLNALGVA